MSLRCLNIVKWASMECNIRNVGRIRVRKCNRCRFRYHRFLLKHHPKQRKFGEIVSEFLSLMCMHCGYYECVYVDDIEYQEEKRGKWHRIQHKDMTRICE